MKPYHKIQSVFYRDPESNYKTLIHGRYSLPELEHLKDNQWEFTEKVDGTNIRVIFSDGRFTFAGRTDKAQLPAQLLSNLTGAFPNMRSFFEANFNSPVCFYGEGFGAGIQSGEKYGHKQDFVLFDILVGGLWLRRLDVQAIAEELSIPVVPLLGVGTLNDMVKIVRSGLKSHWGDFPAEGIVARAGHGLLTRNGDRIITKLKTRDF